MTELSPLPRNQREIDAGHLKLLWIFHFVGAGLACLGILFLIAHYVLFHAVVDNPKFWQNQKQPLPPAQFFAALKWFYLIFAVWFISSAVLNLVSALCLRARKHRTFSIIVGAINCVYIPLGTVLGIFTIVILARNSVRELYQATSSASVSDWNSGSGMP